MDESAIELSVVIPCLNEADTLVVCIQKAQEGLKAAGCRGEIVVADNGSTDGSQQLAVSAGARVVSVPRRGYGAALMGGIDSARGQFVLMGDADDSYDFREIPRFLEKLRAGAELVQGCRFPSAGGTIRPGAMPWLHRFLGNPMLTWICRLFFRVPVHDIYCGMRGFRRDLYQRLGQRCTGMEFATEMIIKARLMGGRIVEVPITLHPDGRTSHPPHLRTFRDGWRTLRFFLLFSPRWLFLIPGLALIAVGLAAYLLALPGIRLSGVQLDAHTLVFGSLFILMGYQAVTFALLAKTYAIAEGFLPVDRRVDRFYEILPLERGLVVAFAAGVAGLGLLGTAVWNWTEVGFGGLDYAHNMRLVIPGMTLVSLAFQSILFGFMASIIGMKKN
jgi:glycosyltransferase involved in cell wall biosynthesis